MKKSTGKLAALLLAVALLGALTGCATSAGTNAKIYMDNMKRILFSGSNNSSNASTTPSQNSSAPTIDAPANFTVEGDTYRFDAVEGAAQYLMYLCEPGSTSDDDTYIYSGVIAEDGSASYTGSIADVVSHAYGEYTAKVFAMTEGFAMSAGVSAPYSVSGELPAPELAWSWDGQGVLTLQVANTDAYDASATPDEISVTLTGPEGDQPAVFDSGLGDITVEGIAPGEYTAKAAASSASSFVTAPNSAESSVSIVLGGEEAASENYVKPQMGGPGGMGGGWEVKPSPATFEEGAESFKLNIGEPDFLKTTAKLQTAADEGSTYTYVLENGDPNAPFAAECVMKLQIKADGTTTLTTTAAGPLNATTKNGTWTSADGSISLAW